MLKTNVRSEDVRLTGALDLLYEMQLISQKPLVCEINGSNYRTVMQYG